jgi:hypothetical protein
MGAQGATPLKRTKQPPPEELYGEDEEVMIEPLPGHGDDEIVAVFEGSGAAPPRRLAPKFFSGKVPSHLRERVHRIATVHRKARKRLH